ncbi:MAG: ATP-binding cassette domain-containing protein, partial [Vicinamibacteria bacterium]
MSAPAALSLVGVEKRFGATTVIRGVSLDIPSGERHAIIGPNGAGKSTLFNLISGRFAPTRGSILLDGANIAGERPFAINRRGLSRSFQVTNIFPRMSVFENLRCAVLWSLGYRYCFWRNADDRDADFQGPLLGVGQHAGGQVAARREAELLEHRRRPVARVGERVGVAPEAVAVAERPQHGAAQVLEHRHPREDVGDLEAARKPAAVDRKRT